MLLLMQTLTMPMVNLATVNRACLDLVPSVLASVPGSVPVSVPGLVSGDTSLALTRLQARQVNPYGGSGDPEWKEKRDHDSLIVLIVVLLLLAVITAYCLVSWQLGLKGFDCCWWCLSQMNPKKHWEAWCAFWKDRTRQRRRLREGIELQPYSGPPPDAPYQRLPSPARPAPALTRLGHLRSSPERRVTGAGQ
ncbi:hypothetical protein F1880_003443 [Penicillium rolfsii]|nr:hypothetical protein F1880_003443 [Penicillium rolfsii]